MSPLILNHRQVDGRSAYTLSSLARPDYAVVAKIELRQRALLNAAFDDWIPLTSQIPLAIALSLMQFYNVERLIAIQPYLVRMAA